jgi:hypothetical protein
MTTQNGAVKSSKAAIKELLEGRTKILEKLAGQLEKWEQAKAAVATAQAKADDEAAAARTIYQEAMDAGWTAAELTGAGLKPPAPPRRRSAVADAIAGGKQASSSE